MKRWIYVMVPFLIIFTLIAWRLHVKFAADAQQTKMHEAAVKAPPPVTVATAVIKTIQHSFQSVGSVETPLDVKLSSKVNDRVQSVQAQPGDAVHAGQVLVVMDPRQIESDVLAQQANVAQARFRLSQAQLTQNPTNVQVTTQISQQVAGLDTSLANYKQVRDNYDKQVAVADGAVTDAQGRVDSAEASMVNARAVIRSAQANLENSRSQYRRSHGLFLKGFVAAKDVDTAATAVKVQEASVDVAQAQLGSAKSSNDSAMAQLEEAKRQASITRTTGQAGIETARAQVVQARAALEYARANVAQKPAYVANLEALRAAVAAAVGQLGDTQSLLVDCQIRSPIDGFVAQRLIDPGTVVTAGQEILDVQYLKQVWITIPVPEEEIRRIYVGQSATITFDALPGRTFTGKISQVPRSADPISRQFPVRVTLDNPDYRVQPGMFARATIVTDPARPSVTVPPEAINKTKDGTFVLLVDDTNTVHKTPVTVGAAQPDAVAILSGLAAGDRVVVMTGPPLKDGQVVSIGGQRPGFAGGPGAAPQTGEPGASPGGPGGAAQPAAPGTAPQTVAPGTESGGSTPAAGLPSGPTGAQNQSTAPAAKS